MALSRRRLIHNVGAFAAMASLGSAESHASTASTIHADRATTNQAFEPWRPGTLELHHIATGRGNSTFILCPDGTTLLIDAGAIYDPLLYTIAPRPNNLRRPGEWIARYITRRLAGRTAASIDYAMLTHFHGDHIGASVSGLPRSRHGHFQLTGITDVAETHTIGRLIDRGYPRYDYAAPVNDPTFLNYRAFVEQRATRGGITETLQVGSSEQIALLHRREAYPTFKVTNLASNGMVAAAGGQPVSQFPALDSLTPDKLPNENMCSQALRISYGPFSYYNGGDLCNDTDFGNAPWRDIETPVAKAAGPVTVAVANHHGYVNSMGPEAVRSLKPQVFVVFAWDSAHPTIGPLFNMLSHKLYPGDRRIYATAVKPENIIATRDIAKMTSREGHVVVRVAEGGETFEVLIVDNHDEGDRIRNRQGPFPSARPS